MRTNEVIATRLVDGARLGRRLGTGMVALALVLVMASASSPARAKPAPDSFADLAQRLLPAVVNVSTSQAAKEGSGPQLPQLPPGSPFEDFFKEFFERNQPQQRRRPSRSLGSGFIVDSSGYVVTNNHVIEGADEITVVLQDDTRIPAEVVGRDPKTDLAVLKIKPTTRLQSVSFGDSDASRVGDWIIAIGNPFGLGGTVTAGIISARGRNINSGPYDDFIQTDASINRGNSGGPMFNLDGEVIGVNTAIFSPSGGSVGIGFAIPSTTVRLVIRQLIDDGQVRRGWLGVHIQTVTDELAENLGLDQTRGALVASVIKGGPAEAAKIKAGDVILTFDGKKVGEMRRLPRIVAETPVGKSVEALVWRDKAEIRLSVTVGELDEKEPQVASRGPGGGTGQEETFKDFGLTLSEVTPGLRKRYELAEDAKGVVVTGVGEGGLAAEKGIRPGDLIVEVNQDEVNSIATVHDSIGKARQDGKKTVLFLVEGQGGLRFVALRIKKG
ncbi:MAG: Do family serine endopeptidase [Rhodospirillales bacterium]|nr:Do family serine endopeptidase [Rhodospirillales bacterium]